MSWNRLFACTCLASNTGALLIAKHRMDVVISVFFILIATGFIYIDDYLTASKKGTNDRT